MRTWQRWTVITSSVVLASAAGMGIAMAAIPDSGGVIHGCYKTPVPVHGNPLSVIDSGAGGTCPSGYANLTWNQTGPQGATGAQGPAGPAGPPGISGYQIITATPSNGYFSTIGPAVVAVVTCPSGDKALSGGGTTEDSGGNITAVIADSAPVSGGTGWRVTFYAPAGGSNSNDLAYAVCANVAS